LHDKAFLCNRGQSSTHSGNYHLTEQDIPGRFKLLCCSVTSTRNTPWLTCSCEQQLKCMRNLTAERRID